MTRKECLSVSSGIYMLCKSILGSSIVFLAHTFHDLGIVVGSIAVAAMAIVNIYSLKYIMIVARETESENLMEIADHIDKKPGKVVVTFLLFAICMIPITYYINISTTYYHEILKHYKISFIDENIVRIATACIGAFLCVAFRKVDKLKNVNVVGLASLSMLTLYSIYLFVSDFSNISFTKLNAFPESIASFKTFGIICFAYCSQFSILSITTNVDSTEDCNKIIWSANIISGIIYFLTGFCGYAARPFAKENYLNGINETYFTTLLKFALGTVNVCTFPLIMLPTRAAFHYFANGCFNLKHGFATDSVESILLMFICFLGSYLCENHGNLLIAGFNIFGSLVMFALPSYFYLRVMRKNINAFSGLIMLVNMLLTLFGFYLAGIDFQKYFKTSSK